MHIFSIKSKRNSNEETLTESSSIDNIKMKEMEMRLAELEEQNEHLRTQNTRLENQVEKLTRSQTVLQKLLSSHLDKKSMEDAIRTPLTIGVFTTVKNHYTMVVEKYLHGKFGQQIEEYDSSKSYDLILVVVYRSSGSLDKIMDNRELTNFSQMSNCYFVCAHGSVWDDRCNYEQLLTKFAVRGVLQFNVWNNQIQTRCSPHSVDSMKQVDDWINGSVTQKTISGMISNLLKLPIKSLINI
jgi:hypothetical protein